MFSSRYLNKRSVPFRNWKLPYIKSNTIFSSVVVIPAYRELEYLGKTLSSLNAQIDFELSNLLVVVVVNNSNYDSEGVLENNNKTIHFIKMFDSKFRLECIDASTKGYALPDNLSGVGYARKIGMDFALRHSSENTILHCLDADTIVSKSYLSKVALSYKSSNVRALVVDFEHQIGEDRFLNKKIKEYEIFLKETARMIHHSGSPYGHVALGPTITCLAKTYVSVGGMVPKKATEDFYFLQKIRKFTQIHFLSEKLVFPSSRLSDRVYLGTGFRMEESLDNEKSISNLYYSRKSFSILKKTISTILSMYRQNLESLNKKLLFIDNSLCDFFLNEGLCDIWDKLNNESKTTSQFELQFHKWFDNLKTLRLLKFYS